LLIKFIQDILRAVSHLQVKYALKLCEEYLIEETSCENCIDMLNLAELFSINNVKHEVNRYILRNFDRLIKNDQFKRLSLEQMQQCLKRYQKSSVLQNFRNKPMGLFPRIYCNQTNIQS
jgi:hypothetical protein